MRSTVSRLASLVRFAASVPCLSTPDSWQQQAFNSETRSPEPPSWQEGIEAIDCPDRSPPEPHPHKAAKVKACPIRARLAMRRIARERIITRGRPYHARQRRDNQAIFPLRRFFSLYIARSASSTAASMSMP